MSENKIVIENLNMWYGNFHALKGINAQIKARRITAIIGPSGCGKSTLLRTFNRMNDLIDYVRITGSIYIDNDGVYLPQMDLINLRKKVGMVFQRPNPFPLSIFENVAFGLRIHHIDEAEDVNAIVEHSLQEVGLWDELKDRLRESALRLSLEQRQRLCIARLIALKSNVLLMDEPCSALDPLATLKIEELMQKLKEYYTIVIVTHNMQQAARVSDDTGYMLLGELIEFNMTEEIFKNPRDKRTEDYITGRFG